MTEQQAITCHVIEFGPIAVILRANDHAVIASASEAIHSHRAEWIASSLTLLAMTWD
jgi:hypothetical protein